MDSIVELVKRNEQLLLENAEALNDEEVEQEEILTSILKFKVLQKKN